LPDTTEEYNLHPNDAASPPEADALIRTARSAYLASAAATDAELDEVFTADMDTTPTGPNTRRHYRPDRTPGDQDGWNDAIPRPFTTPNTPYYSSHCRPLPLHHPTLGILAMAPVRRLSSFLLLPHLNNLSVPRNH
jgi:hypothetical protein